jgi:hypothetical protein
MFSVKEKKKRLFVYNPWKSNFFTNINILKVVVVVVFVLFVLLVYSKNILFRLMLIFYKLYVNNLAQAEYTSSFSTRSYTKYSSEKTKRSRKYSRWFLRLICIKVIDCKHDYYTNQSYQRNIIIFIPVDINK